MSQFFKGLIVDLLIDELDQISIIMGEFVKTSEPTGLNKHNGKIFPIKIIISVKAI